MAKSAAQKRATEQVQKRLTDSVPLRLDAESKEGGGPRAPVNTVKEIHPSLEGLTESLDEAGLNQGTVTTADGLQVRIARNNRYKSAGYQPQSLETSETPKKAVADPHPPLQEGVSQRYEQRVGGERGAERAAALNAEADAVAARPNPLRSDGLVDNMVGTMAPSMGGNRLGYGGALSALAKSRAHLGEYNAQRRLGYTDEVQTEMYRAARGRLVRQQQTARRGIDALTDDEVSARAYAHVTEHLDEAVHGTRDSRPEPRDELVTLQNDLKAQQLAGARGHSVVEAGKKTGAALPVQRADSGPSLGATRRRTPNQQAQRDAVRALQRNGWAAATKANVAEAAKNDLEEITLRQKARKALEVHPSERNTMSPGADPEAKAWANAQPVISTGPAAPFAPTGKVGVGIPARRNRKTQVLAPSARAGAVPALPPDLPTGPARLGRTRAERGVRGSTAPWAPKDNGVIKTYGAEIADYTASRTTATPKTQRPRTEASAVPASDPPVQSSSNVSVAQTAEPKVKTLSIAEKRAAQRAAL